MKPDDPGILTINGLGFRGLGLKEQRNTANEGVIAVADARLAVRVIQTDEAWMIADTVCRALVLG